MEVGQGPNWGCSAKGKKISIGDEASNLKTDNISTLPGQEYHTYQGTIIGKCGSVVEF
jgi:hypothetical protein